MGKQHGCLPGSVDRLREAHWHLHQMEMHYHFAEPFRFSLCSFLRALKEVPSIIQSEGQNVAGFPSWLRDEMRQLQSNALVRWCGKTRDVVVHRSMLLPTSRATIGITEGRGIKFGLGTEIDPGEDSDKAMLITVAAHATAPDLPDLFGLFEDDEESVPCVERNWFVDFAPDVDCLDLCMEAYTNVSELVDRSLEQTNHPRLGPLTNCFSGWHRCAIRLYPRNMLRHAREKLSAGASVDDVIAELHAAQVRPTPHKW